MPPFGALYAPSETCLPSRIGAYRVVRLLATGRTSDVLLAREEGPHGFERVVALKVLLPQFRDDDAYVRLFVREALACARLAHPAVARLYHLLSDAGELALVFEYVEGLPLHRLRADLHRAGARLRDDAALFIAYRLFSALSAAHGARDPVSGEFSPVIHGDVNPSNLLVPWDGYVKIIDFGDAKVSGAAPGAFAMPFPRSHLAPEQARGEPVTVRADLYSACLILWELLTGRRVVLRRRESDRELLAALSAPRLPPLAALRPDLPKAVQDIVARGLRADPDRRDLSAEEACDVLRSVADLVVARNALAEGLAGLRFASIDDARLATTPNLPPYGRPEESALRPLRPPSMPSFSQPQSPHFAVPMPSPEPPPLLRYTSERPVVLSELGAGVPTKRFLSALVVGAALGVTLLGGSARVWRHRAPPAAPAAQARSPRAFSSAEPTPEAPPAPVPSAPPAVAKAVSNEASAAVLPVASKDIWAHLAPPPSADDQGRPGPGSTEGALVVPPSRAGHRVWVDGRLVGQSPGTFAVHCGLHAVRVGSRGPLQRVVIPCGAEVTVR